MITTVEERDAILDKMKAVLEKGWTQNWYARDAHGQRIDALNPNKVAVAWCIKGAMYVALNERFGSYSGNFAQLELMFEEAIGTGRWSAANYNDAQGRTKEDMLALIEKVRRGPL